MKVNLLLNETRLAARRLLSGPVFSAFTVGTLAVAIGVTTACYSVLSTVFRESPQVPEAGRVFAIAKTEDTAGRSMFFTELDVLAIRAERETFVAVTAWSRVGAALVGGGSSKLVQLEIVDGEYFRLLGVRSLIGRLIEPVDDRSDATPAIVLSESVWRSQFGANPEIVGTTVRLSGRALTVMGVAAGGFRGVGSPIDVFPRAWIPLSLEEVLRGTSRNGETARLRILARLSPGVVASQAEVVVRALGARDGGRSAVNRAVTSRRWWLIPLTDAFPSSVPRIAMIAILALPLLVLLIACSNLANLTLARGASRSGDLAVRFALGGSLWHTMVGPLVEASIVGGLGCVLAMLLASALMNEALTSLAGPLAAIAPGLSLHWHFELRAFGAALVATLLSLLVAGLTPAYLLSSASMQSRLSELAGSTAAPRTRARRNVIAVQVGATVVLLLLAAGAARLVLRSSREASGLAGDVARRTVVSYVPFDVQGYAKDQSLRTISALIEAVQRVPGVQAVGVGNYLPIALPWSPSPETSVIMGSASGLQQRMSGRLFGLTAEAFPLLDMSVVVGRLFNNLDRSQVPPIVLNETLALALFGTVEVTGRSVYWTHDRVGSDASAGKVIHEGVVVGVVRGGGLVGSAAQPVHVAFLPLAAAYVGEATIAVRVAGPDATPLVDVIENSLRGADPNLAIPASGRADRIAGAPVLIAGVVARWAVVLALMALLLSMSGLYGVLSHLVAARIREIAVRMSLGAPPMQILRLIIMDGVRPVVEGLLIGFGASLVLWKVVQAAFAESVRPIDAGSLIAVTLLVLIVAVITCSIPAMRASRVEPAVLLKDAWSSHR